MVDTKESWTIGKFALDPHPIPVSGCTSPAYFEAEVDNIFRKTWINVGREEEIPKPGAYVVRDFAAMKTSVIVVRGHDNVIRGFHNVCSHRCNRVLWKESGAAHAFACQFHGWTYGLDGQLLRVTDEDQFFDLDKAQNGLAPVALEVWEGFIFINLDPKPAQSLKDYMGPIHEGLKGYPFAGLSQCYAWTIELNCNWKILKDAFSELYHVPFIHDASSGDNFTNQDTLSHALAFDLFQNGGQFSIYGNPNFSETPVAALANRFGSTMLKRNEQLIMGEQPKMFNPAGSQNWAGEMIQLFPSFQLSLFPGFYLMHNFMPIAHNKCRWEFRNYFAPPTSAAAMFCNEWSAVQTRDAVLEDCRTLEYTQQVLENGVKRHFNLSDQEVLVRANHLITQRMAGPYPAFAH